MKVSDAVRDANVPALIPTLAMLTGDERWLSAPYAPARQKGLDDNHDGGLPLQVQAEIRAAAAAAIASGDVKLPEPSHEQLVRMLSVAMGEAGPGRVRADDRAGARARRAAARARAGAGRVPRDRHRRGDLGPGHLDPARRGGHPARRPGAQRHRRRDLAREPLPGRRRGHAERAVLVLVRAAGLVAVLRAARRAARLPGAAGGRLRRARADPLRLRGPRRGVRRGRAGVGGPHAGRRRCAPTS